MRLFVAIELSDEVRAALAEVQTSLRKWSQTVRWIDPAQLHMTLKFLGETPEGRVPSITKALEEATAGLEPFDLALTQAGCFPPRGQVRIAWVATEDASGRLLSCVEQVEAKIAPLGFPREARPFTAHLTIGRVRDDSSGGEFRSAMLAAKVRQVRQRVSQVTLMQSRLSPKGASYSVVSTARLASRRL